MSRNQVVEILNEVLIGDNRGVMARVCRIAEVAARTGYDYCYDGRINPPVSFIRAAFQVTEDPRLKALLEPHGWRLTRAQPVHAPT